ncbi:hypothetical protein B0H13DRAFT_2331793 [Mycena leptocephala]|nr:hypothetical protein B0H13DRAFT_2331793 [Mycena leptocephala]
MAFTTLASVIEQPEAVDGVVPVEQLDDNHLDPDYNNDDSGRGSDGEDGSYDSSNTSEEEDNVNDSELDDAVAQIAPPSVRVKIPPAKFDIPFEVPYKNGMRDLKGITSVTTFDDFLAAAAGKMGTRITQMDNIAYIPSYKPRNPKPIPKILDDDAWEALVGDVRQHVKATQAGNHGKGQLKPFSIQIVDLSTLEDDGKKGAGKKASLTRVFPSTAGTEQTNTGTKGEEKRQG